MSYMEQCNLYWIWQQTHLTVCLQYSPFTVCFQTELKPKIDILTNLSGHCNSGILPNNSMSETLSCSHTGVPHGAGGEQDSQVLDGAAQPLCLHLTVQVAVLIGCSGKACRARTPIRSPICFCTSSTSVGLPWFSACSVKLQLLWMFSFPCSSAVSWACSTYSNINIWYNYSCPFNSIK